MQLFPQAEIAANNPVSDSLKMTLFFVTKRFYPRLNLDTSQQTNNQKTHNFIKHIDDTLKQFHANLLIF